MQKRNDIMAKNRPNDMLCRMSSNTEIDRLRSYSSVFSRSVFSRLIKFDDFSAIDRVGMAYDEDRISGKISYANYLDWMYLTLANQYRNEYVFKNALINKIVSLNKGRNITVFNEFKVGDSIADIATFNGKSCVYEIKTELDSPKRIESQQDSYFKFFQECYLVAPKERVEDYLPYIDDRMGVLAVNSNKGKVTFSKYRKAEHLTDNMDVDVLMRVLWIPEYESIVKQYFGALPQVGYYEMYEVCKELLRKIPVDTLSRMVVEIIKKRKRNDLIFDNAQKSLTQICLALNINSRQYLRLCDNLNKTITI